MTDQSIALPPSTGWFQILHQIVDSGALARMHPSAAALYIAIKRYADYHTGLAEISNKRLCQVIGVSKPTFNKAKASLQENGIISVVGRHFPTRYIVHERICYYTADRAPVASIEFPYIPCLQPKILETLRSQPLTIDQIGTTLTIGTVNVQVINIIGSVPVEKGQGR